MTLDPEMLKKMKAAEARLAEADTSASLARAEYNTCVRRAHLAGGSLREIAASLGISHQRVQQIVDAAGGSWWKAGARDMVCTFCGRPPSEVSKLLRGPNVFVCDGCVELAERAVAGRSSEGATLGLAASGRAPCSFCGERRAADRPVVLGPTSTICAPCVGVCRQILNDSGGDAVGREPATPARPDYVD